MKRYTIYKIIDLITSEYYIGIHYTSNPYDNYMGSGIHITRKVKKYGKSRFKKDILFILDNKNEALQKEKDLIKEHKNNPLCLNIADGGEGGSNFKGKHHNKESMIKMIETRIKNGHRFPTEETKRKISEGQIGRKAWNKGLKYNNDRLFTDEHKRKIRESVLNTLSNKEKYKHTDEIKNKIRLKALEREEKKRLLKQKSETDI